MNQVYYEENHETNDVLETEQNIEASVEETENLSQEPYFGSVRFFKHVILSTVALLILVPTVLSVVFGVRSSLLDNRVDRLSSSLEQMEQDLALQATSSESSVSSQETQPALQTDPPEYQALFPEMTAPEAEYASLYKDKTVYLTFDDGPSERTPEVLEILEEYDIKATFFVVGKSDEQSKQWMRDIVEAGHTLGMHTYSHDYERIYASPEAYLEDMNKIYHLVGEATGQYPTIFRFPGGSINSYNHTYYRELISEMLRRGFVYYDWNVTNGDASANTPSVERLISNATQGISTRNRAIVLMHDSVDRVNTVASLPTIIETYLDAGFTFEALSPEVVPVTYGYEDYID